jgi:hypothetical protein
VRILITLITSLSLSLPAFANVAVHDLPYLEGTPLVSDFGDASWTLLDYAEAEGGFTWAWLENAGSLAYVVYPDASASVTFPDGTLVNADPENVVMEFLGEEQRLEFTRFGGMVVLQGSDIRATFSAELTPSDEGINVELWSDDSITLTGSISAYTIHFFLGSESLPSGTPEGRFTVGLVATDLVIDGSSDWTLTTILKEGSIQLPSSEPSSPVPNCQNSSGMILVSSGTENLSQKNPCVGDFYELTGHSGLITMPPKNDGFVVLPAEENIAVAVPAENKPTQSSSPKKSGGGSTGVWLIGLLALLRFNRRIGASSH